MEGDEGEKDREGGEERLELSALSLPLLFSLSLTLSR